jgi:hypothetical protein
MSVDKKRKQMSLEVKYEATKNMKFLRNLSIPNVR